MSAERDAAHLNAAAVAARLGVSRATVHRFIRERGLPAFTVGRCVRVDSEELERWIKANTSCGGSIGAGAYGGRTARSTARKSAGRRATPTSVSRAPSSSPGTEETLTRLLAARRQRSKPLSSPSSTNGELEAAPPAR